ncbi:hypothetical protein EGW08_005535 [Elysia chlorotica]|uniref:Uncharacterized protein n=1 Tax=Elysia chlorotica TaxID=188477 RepID=A0A3S1BR59_ELYCH|nr:hypothetical protein EGW08_005535 [Elysia chlorotica]
MSLISCSNNCVKLFSVVIVFQAIAHLSNARSVRSTRSSLVFRTERRIEVEADKSSQLQFLLEQSARRSRSSYPWDIRAQKTELHSDATKNLTELISENGYPVEVYTVETADGFLLDVHRIPHGIASHGSSRGVVFLQHALLSSACDWVMNFPNDSLGFILADEGFDVWMGNSRGNTYSRRHITLSPNSSKFWDWSVDEMAEYDMPAFIDFVLNKTGQSSLSLIGHSQGTMMNFALFSQRPDMEKKVRLFIALAPVAFVGRIVSPIAYLSLMSDENIYAQFGDKLFLPNDIVVKILVDLFCTETSIKWICDDILFLFVGNDIRNLNQSRLDVYFHHSPAGVSVKDLVHFAQLFRMKNFGKYDYGSLAANMARYNQSTPPQYDISKVKVPVVAFSGIRDWLSDPADVRQLVNTLPNLKAWYVQPLWNHMDFVWGMTAAQGCYTRIVDWLHAYNF